MAYLSNSDIQSLLGNAAYIELTDDEDTGAADEGIVTTARLGAEGEANSYFARRYRVPIDTSSEPETAAAIKSFVLDLAIYRLHSRRPPIPDDIVRRRTEAIAWLERVSDGTIRLPSTTPIPEHTNVETLGEANGPTRAMTRDSLNDL